ncbi:NUDIX hydrolase [Hydrogenophaga sp. OTU3427]|uniref:NUDIX hydrolase n=1 Tax=Hydrogenophaga sp. OTU3427 TaxID=3043856 RepID=UPI00313C931B
MQKEEDRQHDQLTIRSRIRSDLEALKLLYLPAMGSITESTRSDYQYRAKASRSDLAHAMVHLIGSIGYSNFKNEVQSVQGKNRASLYGRLRTELYQLQLEPEAFEWNSTAAIDKMAVPDADSYGVVLVSPEGQTLLRQVSGGFGGYCWTFAKGRPDGYESPQQTASRELLEEAGYHCKLIGLLPDRYMGTTGSTIFFVGVPVGDQQPFGTETEETRWVGIQEAHGLLQLTTDPIGRDRDQSVLCDLYRWMSARQEH